MNNIITVVLLLSTAAVAVTSDSALHKDFLALRMFWRFPLLLEHFSNFVHIWPALIIKKTQIYHYCCITSWSVCVSSHR